MRFSEYIPPFIVRANFSNQRVIIYAKSKSFLDTIYGLRHLFTWHEESYYGTFIDIKKKKREAKAILPYHMAFSFFATHPESKLLKNKMEWDPELIALRETLPHFYQEYVQGAVKPRFSQWKQGKIAWQFESGVHEKEEINQFISRAITSKLQSEPDGTWSKVSHLYHHPTSAMTQAKTAVNEEAWLKKIGLIEDNAPFFLSLSLEEPEEDWDWWKLHTLLHDKENPHTVYAFEEKSTMPAEWQDFHQHVLDTQAGWGHTAPWLVENGTFKTELKEEEAWLFLADVSEQLLEAGVDILLPAWWEALKKSKLTLKAQLKTPSSPSFVGMNTILGFDWRISTGEVDFSEEDFQKLVDENRRLIHIRGRWIKLDPDFIKQMKLLMTKVETEGLYFKDILEQQFAGEITEVAEEPKVEIELNEYYNKLLDRLTQLQDVPTFSPPSTLQAVLRPYQQKGLEWLIHLRQLGFGALLADDMGLGKTLQTIAYLLRCKELGMLETPALIIAPTSVLGNWQRELEKFAPDLKVHLHYGPTRLDKDDFLQEVANQDVLLTSYTLSHIDQEMIRGCVWGAICLDEAQNIKNAATKQSRAIRSFPSKHKIALTGTPIENRLSELWSIFDFLNAGYLGSLHTFSQKFITPIEKEKNEHVTQKLQRYIQPFLLRRTKQDEEVALNLPEKQEQKEYCTLTLEQASLYEQVVQDTLNELDSLTGIQRKGYVLMMLNKLKQICNHPALYLKEEKPKHVTGRSNKMELLLDLVENILAREESTLIFTQYIGMGEIIKHTLEKKFGVEVLFLNGSVGKQRRDVMISRFQGREVPILLLSLKAGGTGLNLTAANHVIHYDRWWNPAVENQATDRAHRIGQERFVQVHKLITTGTLEEKIDEMLERKQSLSDAIITSESWITELSTEELTELLGG